jgi:hypothetical protein
MPYTSRYFCWLVVSVCQHNALYLLIPESNFVPVSDVFLMSNLINKNSGDNDYNFLWYKEKPNINTNDNYVEKKKQVPNPLVSKY